MSKEFISHDRNMKEMGSRGMGDIRPRRSRTVSTQPTQIIFSDEIELKRAGYGKKELKIETVLFLGKMGIINPCFTCPMFDSKILCGSPAGIQETHSGTLDCPEGKGTINIVSAVK